jgi:hypothetical protein
METSGNHLGGAAPFDELAATPKGTLVSPHRA